MANSEFKTAAAKLLDQHATKNPAAEAMQAESAENIGNGMQAASPVQTQASTAAKKTVAPQPKKIPITMPLLLSLAKSRLSIRLVFVSCAFMWFFVPEMMIPNSFKIINVLLGIIMGLTYGTILAFPHQSEGGTNHEKE